MDELVKKYLDEAKAIEKEIQDRKEQKEKERRDKYLISLGLIKGYERRYSDKNYYPYLKRDKETKQYYYDAPIPVEVTDEELEELKKYKALHDAPTNEKGQHYIPITDEKPKTNNSAEESLGIINYFVLVLGIIFGVILILMSSEYGSGTIRYGFFIIFVALVTWAMVKVYINISNNLHELNAKIKKQ